MRCNVWIRDDERHRVSAVNPVYSLCAKLTGYLTNRDDDCDLLI